MSAQKDIQNRTKKRTMRVKGALRARKGKRLRVSVHRSLRSIFAQIIDDTTHKTTLSCSSAQLKGVQGTKKDIAKHVGLTLGKQAQEKGIREVVFDRGSYRYHGRVAALADGLRESGLAF